MNDVASAPAVAVDPAATVNASNPWLGLASFTEETRAYFFGREEEVAELARRVQRKLLTLLFGQSGLGKTSILRAGLVPRLRSQGYCPIYVRIDYGRDAPEPAAQIKQAILRTARRAGRWSQEGVAAEGESLWEFLHHRDDVLLDEAGATLIPLLIFDQFEEIFTLAQSDEFGRARAARFVAELADLVENRPPKAFEAKLDEDDSAAERFDFARSDYRVLIALREDYLAPLEGLKKQIPSISQNRLRLAPMSGNQALEAVLQPGKQLVSEEVAAAIVRFVAGGAELANAEVEPSLLSLICRELNDARIAEGRSEISLDLLAGSHATILSNFYERALADQPLAVRRVIEDDLLTESGFRENVAEERVVKQLADAGAAPNALSVLVNRRLLRIEERLDIRRVELTHDVLCAVVKSSRDQRQEREAREATERLLTEQRARELAAHRTAVRARQIAGACTVLAAAAIAAAIFGYFSSQRALRAERQAQQTRGQAEHLLGYLSDDFARELESSGRLDVLAEFSGRQIDYFHALPAAARSTETVRNAAMAMVYRARARRALGQLDGAGADAAEAQKLLTQLQKDGDHSEATVTGLGLAYLVQAQVMDNSNDPRGPAMSQRAAELLRPLVAAPHASVAVQRAYAEVLIRIGYEQAASQRNVEAIGSEREAMRIATDLGARELTNLDMGARYVEACGWMVQALESLGRYAETRSSGEDCIALGDKVLAQRPGYRLTLHAQQITLGVLAQLAQDSLDPAAALQAGRRQEQISVTLLNLDPHNVVSINNLGVAQVQLGDALWSAGRLREAMAPYQDGVNSFGHAASGGSVFAMARILSTGLLVYRNIEIGDTAAAKVAVAARDPFVAKLRQSEPAGSVVLTVVGAGTKLADAMLADARDDFETARRLCADAATALVAMKQGSSETEQQKHFVISLLYDGEGRAEYQLGDFAAAERSERNSLEARQTQGGEATDDQRRKAEISTWIALAQARQGRSADAARTLAPVIKLQGELAARNHGDHWLPLELARTRYAEALIDPVKGAGLLTEASHLIDGLSPEVRAAREARQWRERVHAAQQAAPAVPKLAERGG